MMNRIGAAAVLMVLAASACGHPLPPPGGEQDRVAPRLEAATPEQGAVVPGLGEAVVFRFDERISERGIEELVQVSPRTGEIKVDKGRRELAVVVEGGWRPNTIYRIVVLPGLSDLFGNKTERPIEVVFSTGPQIPGNAVAGLVMDRLTGKPATGARVEAVFLQDSLVYTAVVDTAGFYALRSVPSGNYLLRAFMDRVPNRELDFAEPFDTARAWIGDADTLVAAPLSLLPADTTPARVVRAEVKDSLAIQVELDDYVDPETQNLFTVEGVIYRLPAEQGVGDSVQVAVQAVLFPFQLEERRRQERAAQDTARADSARAAAPAGRGAAPARETERLPTRNVIVVPAGALEPDTRYRVVLRRVPNISGLEGGGGTTLLRTAPRKEEPEEAPVVPPDTAAPPDTTGAR